MLHLRLTPLAHDKVIGIYKVGGVAARLPERMRYLHPDAARAFGAIEEWAVISDMFRSPESSLRAVREQRGALPPGFSAHNFGLAIDLDLNESRQNLARRIGRPTVSKAELDEAMESAGWFCHRRDHTNGFEAWHYNALLIGAYIPASNRTTAPLIEARILELYGADLNPVDVECQAALKRLGLYGGAIDGAIGPLSREAVRAFQRTWGLAETGKLEPKTRRTLAYVAAVRV